MKKSRIVVITVAVVTFGVAFAFLRSNIRLIPGLKDANPVVLQSLVIILGIVAAAILSWLTSKKFGSEGGPGGASAAATKEEESQDLDDLIEQAEARLSESQLGKDAKLARLPAIFLLGNSESAKTATMVHSGLDPELLAGQVYEETNLIPTPTVNFWFARRTLLWRPPESYSGILRSGCA